MKKLGLMICLAVILTFLGKNAIALELFEGRLHDIKGSVQQTLNYRTHQDVRDVKFSSFRTTLRIEGLLDCITEPTWNVQLYGLFNYWYDNGTNIDQDLRDAIRLESGGDGGSFGLGAYKKPNTQVQIMKELYFEVAVGEYFMARLGKQMVSWGETAESRVADVINPLDYNNFTAFPDWEDYKIGLWMGRFFYAPPNMWQDISFELIVIPPDFQYNRYPPAGSGLFFGTAQGLTVPLPFGTLYWPDYMARFLSKQRLDAPKNDASNIEFGGRLRGNTWGTDWTLSTFYTRLDSPIFDGAKGAANQQAIVMNKVIKTFGLPMPKSKIGRVYTYPHYLSTAMTFAKPWDWIKSVIRGEVVLNSGKEYNSNYPIQNKTVTRDLLTTAITWDRKNMIPWFSYWNNSRSVGTSLTWYHYKLFGHDHGIMWEQGLGGVKKSAWDKLTLAVDTGFYHDTVVPVFNLAYDPTNKNTTVVGAIRFAPGDHWRWMLVYQQINQVQNSAKQDVGRYQNQLIFSMRYEF